MVSASSHRRGVGAVLLPLLLVAWTTASPRRVTAFDADTHRSITVAALDDIVDKDFLLTATPKELIDFYRWFGFAMAKGGDASLQADFQRRFPDPKSFDAFAIRRFLGLSVDPRADVWAVTRLPSANAVQRLNLYAMASAQPLEDGRLRNQVLIDTDGQVRRDHADRPLLFDPWTARYGPTTGPGSDAWARFSPAVAAPDAVTGVADPEPGWRLVLGDHAPYNFAAALAEAHLDMAVLLRVYGDVAVQVTSEGVALLWLGAAMHFAQLASSPLRVSEAASKTVRVRVRAASTRDALRTVGGYLGPLESQPGRIRTARLALTAMGERWLARQLDLQMLGKPCAPGIAAAVEAMKRRDEKLEAILRPRIKPWLTGVSYTDPWAGGRGGASKLVEAVSVLAARDAEAAFEALAVMAVDAVVAGDIRILRSDQVEDSYWRPREAPGCARAEAKFAEVMGRALVRASTATRLMREIWLNGNSDSAARRLQLARLSYWKQAEARREADRGALPDPFAPEHDARWPAALAALLTLLAVGAGLLVRRRLRAR